MDYGSQRRLVTDIFYAALKAVDPYQATKTHTEKIRATFEVGGYRRLLAVGFGKAACPMAKALEDGLSDIIDRGIVITKYGHCVPHDLRKFKVYEAGHPVPDENGARATGEMVHLLRGADERTLVVYLISGGGSALLVSPCEGITLKEKQAVTELLLKGGADINELNAVRKHLSTVKGGRLSEIAYPARQIALILSDVIGDRLDVIASGPTAPDRTTFSDALRVLEKYSLADNVPGAVLDLFRKGAHGSVPETPKPGNAIFGKVENLIIGNSRKALEGAKARAESLGLGTVILSTVISGEAGEVGRWLAEEAKEMSRSADVKRPICILSGGETTVTVKGKGRGGRNMELALAFAMEIEGVDGICLLSAGTDGTDGPTDAAGAIVIGGTVRKAKAIGLDAGRYLANNDSYSFFQQTGDLFITGPTGTNVMDLQVMVME